jgi:hypothetical protein
VDDVNVDAEEDNNKVSITLRVRVTENGANTQITILVTEQGNVSIV